ncbi:MAG: TPD domain-containing protein [Candidatus Thermoplasmatota archaeon]|nr:TPD domain-containing protein [Candidatus Thermoplasmatota archaeon]
MRLRDYRILYRKLNSVNDIPLLASEFEISEEALLNILAQKIVRTATSRYYKVKSYSDTLLHEWLNGKTFTQLANSLKFPPVLTASLILQQYGISKRRFWKYLTNLELVKEERVREELREACDKDPVYSPASLEAQRRRGEEVEIYVKKWLIRKGLDFERQEQLKKRYRKTPDFLLKSPLKIDRLKINWVECKASFCDPIEFKKSARKQFLPYRKLFGSGLVVYWLGYLEDLRFLRRVIVKDRSYFVQ